MIASKPLKWHGGKHYLAEWIIGFAPDHVHFVETHFGGGAVLFRKSPDGVSEVANDINGELSNFWQVLQDDELFAEFKRQVDATPFSQVEFENASIERHDGDPVMRAVRFFIRYRQSRQGLGKDFATLTRRRTRRGMNEQVSSWLSAVEGLEAAHDRIRRVVVTNMDAAKLIGQQDGAGTLFYCDPPYVHGTRTAKSAYEFEMTIDDHRRLLRALSEITGRFILSGYRNDLYDSVADHFGWHRVDKEIDNKSSSKSTKATMTESLWMNFQPEASK